MRQFSIKRHRFSPDIIRHSIRLYARFSAAFLQAVGKLLNGVQADQAKALSTVELEIRDPYVRAPDTRISFPLVA